MSPTVLGPLERASANLVTEARGPHRLGVMILPEDETDQFSEKYSFYKHYTLDKVQKRDCSKCL
jgi:hypothetical protein